MEPDFSGWATKAGLKCSDGRTILSGAFKGQNGHEVPLVWQHGHKDISNVLGHAKLEDRGDEGVYAYCYFNKSEAATHAREAVANKDIRMMSIWANDLIERSKQVMHGVIREVSLVLSGANPGALIENVYIRHDGEDELQEGEAIIYTGLELEHSSAADDETINHAEDDGGDGEETIADVLNSMTDKQREVVHFMLGKVAEGLTSDSANHSSTDDDQEGTKEMTRRNAFEEAGEKTSKKNVLSHDAMEGIFKDALARKSFKEALHAYAEEHLEHGINDIEELFPEAVAIDGNTPAWITRRMEWVSGWLSGTRKTPFGRIKSHFADLTMEEARAKGYIKGNLKKEQFFSTSRRTTEPKTIYKKQKLDRDDILDITDFDVVAWVRQEMRFMIEEEIARAALIGDGREVGDEDKIDEDKIRPILTDDDFYVTTVYVQQGDASSSYLEYVDAIIANRYRLKGTGTPNLYTTETHLAQFLLLRDNDGHRYFRTVADLAAELRVGQVITVEVMEDEPDVLGIIVNPADYTYGAVRGGQLTTFDDFDIDYNQYKYLIEARLCGALTLPKSAMVIREAAGTNAVVTAVEPTFDPETGELTITDTTGVVYKHGVTTINNAGSPYTVDPGTSWTVTATPASGYSLSTSEDDEWVFTADA